MLDAAVCGEVFASPNARQITTGLEAVASDKGFLPPLLFPSSSFSSSLIDLVGSSAGGVGR